MSLVTFVEDVTTLDAAIQPFYKALDDGGFILDAMSVNGYVVENTEGLKTALAKERLSAKTLDKKVKTLETKFAEVDPDVYRETLLKLEEMSAFDPAKESDKLALEKYETNKKRLESTITKQFELKIKTDYEPTMLKYKAAEDQLRKTLVDSVAVNALLAEGGDESLLLPHMKSALNFYVKEDGTFGSDVVGADGEPIYNNKGERISAMEYASTVLKVKFPGAFKSTVKTGGGAQQTGPASQKAVDTSTMTPKQLMAHGRELRSA